MKTCTKCNEDKDESQFNKEIKRKDGLYPWCKSCLSNHRKERYLRRGRKVWIENKVCSRCKEDKPRDQFRIYPERNLHPQCISCEDEKDFHLANGFHLCGCCKNWKVFTDFYPSRRDGHHATCIECTRKQYKTDYERRRDYNLRKTFGISLLDYDNLVEKQGYKCPVCLEELEKGNRSYAVDHAHGGEHKGKVRAIVHNFCNRYIIGKHSEGSKLRRAADIIDNPLTDWIVPDKKKKKRKKKI